MEFSGVGVASSTPVLAAGVRFPPAAKDKVLNSTNRRRHSTYCNMRRNTLGRCVKAYSGRCLKVWERMTELSCVEVLGKASQFPHCLGPPSRNGYRCNWFKVGSICCRLPFVCAVTPGRYGCDDHKGSNEYVYRYSTENICYLYLYLYI